MPGKASKLLEDALHCPGFFSQGDATYIGLLTELTTRERADGDQKTYWQNGKNLAVTRVKKVRDLTSFPVHARVILRLAEYFHAEVEGWWVNHYKSGSGPKNMHKDGWGRDRGVNITITASFGDTRTLRFEAVRQHTFPQILECAQANGDVLAFGEKVNEAFKHGVPPEPLQGPRISIVVMAKAPTSWLLSVPQINAIKDPSRTMELESSGALASQPKRRWGYQAAPDRSQQHKEAEKTSNAARRWGGSKNMHSQDLSLMPSASPAGPASVIVVWLRDDMRLTDNPALYHALQAEPSAVVPVFIHDDADPAPWPLRGAALWWKGQSLLSFDASLRQHCASKLVIRRGAVCEQLLSIARTVRASHVFFNRLAEPWYRERDLEAAAFLTQRGLVVETFKAALLQEPWEGIPPSLPGQHDEKPPTAWDEVEPGRLVANTEGQMRGRGMNHVSDLTLPQVVSLVNADRLLSNPNPCAQLLTALGDTTTQGADADHRRRDPDHFLVYQAFEAGEDIVKPLPTLKGRPFPPPAVWPLSCTVQELGYSSTRGNGFPRRGMPQQASTPTADSDWARDMRKAWQPGEEAALARLTRFVNNIETHKRPDRHRGDLPNTSLLSPHLRFGEVSARTCYFEALRAPAHLRHGFIRRVLWRDLSYAELYYWRDMPIKSQRPQYDEQAWSGTEAQLRKWQRGRTGYPLVDAAMRQLWREGYINNYLRHVVAGFLIDHLDLSWKHGLAWFDYTLLDADTAINARLWQQGGHSGISQWNFVLHPVYAAKNADPEGNYVRRWVPELAKLSTEYIHRPWDAPCELMNIGVKLGVDYCKRMLIDLDEARKKHLRAISQVRLKHPEMMHGDGTEYLFLKDGSRVLLRTRDDIRLGDTDKLIVKQSPGEDLHRSSRRRAVPSSSWQGLLEEEVVRRPVSQAAEANSMHIL
eukprot:TRINITY_DN111394_c0_g1_i1.p1 TRINITY_DN111394_c0_g1~~TRINITY_DN111394_c0_g1_i1.p1  ORF type:complete len:928 (-),score=91.94 TRINITY_DN111394_c0_g1_i1:37-2820(-)